MSDRLSSFWQRVSVHKATRFIAWLAAVAELVDGQHRNCGSWIFGQLRSAGLGQFTDVKNKAGTDSGTIPEISRPKSPEAVDSCPDRAFRRVVLVKGLA